MSNSKISYSQFLCLFFVNRIVMVLTFLPIFNAPPKNQDVWLSVVFMYPFSILVSMPLIYLCSFISKPYIYKYPQYCIWKIIYSFVYPICLVFLSHHSNTGCTVC